MFRVNFSHCSLSFVCSYNRSFLLDWLKQRFANGFHGTGHTHLCTFESFAWCNWTTAAFCWNILLCYGSCYRYGETYDGVTFVHCYFDLGWIRDETNYTVTLHCLNIATYLTAIAWGLEMLYTSRREKKDKTASAVI